MLCTVKFTRFLKLNKLPPYVTKILLLILALCLTQYFGSSFVADNQPATNPAVLTNLAANLQKPVKPANDNSKLEKFIKTNGKKRKNPKKDSKQSGKKQHHSNLSICPAVKKLKHFVRTLHQGGLHLKAPTEDEIMKLNPAIEAGGTWRPKECIRLKKVAIIIPYRDRIDHLLKLLKTLFPMLQRQMLDFRIIVAEQYGNDLFNKGRIMNAAFTYAETLNVDCVIFHDVDMFPQDDRITYECPNKPRHIGAYVNTHQYQLWYHELVGGVFAITMKDYRKVNGYSNVYWGWGGEDDDMAKRIISQKLEIERLTEDYAKYTMLDHEKRKRVSSKLVLKLVKEAESRWKTDGINEASLWTINRIDVRPLYYHLSIDVGKPPPEWKPNLLQKIWNYFFDP